MEFHIEGDLESRRSVYFTDQAPCFEIVAKNVSDRPVEGGATVRTTYEKSLSVRERGEYERLDLDLDPEEIETFEFCLDMLSYQGSAAIGFDRKRIHDHNDYWEIKNSSSNSLTRAYTFMIYDRDYYKMNYLWPRRAQYLAAILSVLIVLVGVIQIITLLTAS